jgi:hypothetical protein
MNWESILKLKKSQIESLATEYKCLYRVINISGKGAHFKRASIILQLIKEELDFNLLLMQDWTDTVKKLEDESLKQLESRENLTQNCSKDQEIEAIINQMDLVFDEWFDELDKLKNIQSKLNEFNSPKELIETWQEYQKINKQVGIKELQIKLISWIFPYLESAPNSSSRKRRETIVSNGLREIQKNYRITRKDYVRELKKLEKKFVIKHNYRHLL